MQMLCVNESYDRNGQLLLPNKAILVIGEVNNDEDKPKIFPREILALEEAPRRLTKQVHFLAAYGAFDARPSGRPGAGQGPSRQLPSVPLSPKADGRNHLYRVPRAILVAPSLQLQRAVDEAFGEETYYASVDTSLRNASSAPGNAKTAGRKNSYLSAAPS
jgi:hypothetical protein